MKLIKETLRKMIQEEIDKQLEEQNSFVQAGDKAARKRAKSMQSPSAVEKFISEPGGLETASDMVSTAAAEFDKVKGKETPMKIKGKRGNPLLMKVQQQLIRLGAFDFNSMEPIKADGMAGPITATALSAVLPGFQCIGRTSGSRRRGCDHSAKFLKNPALLRTALAALSKKKPFSKDQMVAVIGKALRNKKDVVDVTANQIMAQITNPIETKPTASPTPKKPAGKEPTEEELEDLLLRNPELSDAAIEKALKEVFKRFR